MAIEGVILDVDGTLVSSNDAHAYAWVEAFANYGYEIPFDRVRPLIGMGGDQVVPQLVPELNGKEGLGKEIAERRKELIINKFGTELAPTIGARDLVKKLRDDGVHLIIASSATEQEMDVLLKAAQVNDLVSEFTTSSDAEASKPEPDLIEAALGKAHLEADRTVMLGDTPYDIESAKKAGVNVIAFRTGGFSDQELQGAIAIYDDPADLLRQYQTSPLAATATAQVTNGSRIIVPDTATTETVDEAWETFQTKASTFFANATAPTKEFFKHNQSRLINIGWVLLALLGLQLLFSILDIVDNLPLISPILKLVGLIYIGWLVWRYLLRASNRQELVQMIDRAKAEFFGDRS